MKIHSLSQCAAIAGLLFVALLTVPHLGVAQSETPSAAVAEIGTFVQVTLNDGSLKYGTLVEMNESDVVLSIVGLGATRIPKYLVQSMAALDVNAKEIEQGYAYVSNQPSRYFFAPSGMQLAKGDGYFQSNIALNSISYGFSDRFTGGVMISVLGAGLTAKFGGQVGENVHMSAGGLAFVDYYGNMDRPLLLGFANVTFGDENKNLTFNLGLGNKFEGRSYYSDLSVDSTFVEFPDGTGYWDVLYNYATLQTGYQNPFLFNVSGMLPLMPNRWFITENYLVLPAFERSEAETLSPPLQTYYPAYYTAANFSSDPGGGISIGIRSYNKQSGWLWDYGLAGVYTGGSGFPVPWFSFTLEF